MINDYSRRRERIMADADDITKNLAVLDEEIGNLERILLLARESGFEDLAERLVKDLTDARRWRSKFVAALRPAS
jgi:hypothetical protein